LLDHSKYEAITALVGMGEDDVLSETFSENEVAEWRRHRQACAQCQEALTQYHSTHLVLVAEAATAAELPEQLIACEQELRLGSRRRSNSKRRNGLVMLWAITATVVLVAVAITPLFLRERTRTAGQLPAIVNQAVGSNISDTPASRIQMLNDQLRLANKRAEELMQSLATRQTALDEAHRQEDLLKSRISELEQQNGVASGKLSQLQQQMETMESQRKADGTAFAVEESELESLRARVSSLTGELNQARRLDEATKLARKLMADRNVYVITLHDNDPNGKPEKAFGRMYYEPGQQLLFYAYDLPPQSSQQAHVSFYVWAEKGKAKESIRSLGVLHVDDQEDSRWVLTIDDPKNLTDINAVFVTAEAGPEPTVKPSGKRLFSARLDVKPNQP
jgi:hypothetical protein